MKPDRHESPALLYVSVLIMLASVAFLPFYGIRANRTASGEGVGLWTASTPEALIMAACLVAALAGFALRRHAIARTLGFAALCAALAVSFIAPARGSLLILEFQPPQARVALGTGFLVWLLAMYVALASYAPAFGSRSARAMNLALLSALACMVALAAAGALDGLSIAREYANRRGTFLAEAARHGLYAAGSTTAALLVALPLGYASARSRFWERPVFLLANAAQAVPTLSLLGLLIVPLSLLGSAVPALGAIGVRGVGWAPASIVLFLYALLPITANAQAGFRGIEPAAKDASLGMGMTRKESLYRVELPLAMPAVIAGFRTALTQNLGNAVLAGLVGGGGLGSLIFLGLAQAAPDLILLGSLPVIAAVFASDRLLAAVESFASRRTGLHGASA